MLKIKNQADDSAEMYIYGDIIDDDDGAWLKSYDMQTGYQFPADIRTQLDSLKGKDLTIYINSNGGSVPAGVAIANMLARHDGHTKAIVDGWCCSIATQIFFACEEREIPSNAYLMVHKPKTCACGNADDMRKAADSLDTIQAGLESTYLKAAKDGVTADDIREMVNNETWLTGDQAAEYFILNVTDAQKTAAYYGGKGMTDKIPTGIKPVEDINISNDENEIAEAKIKLALAKVKGAFIE